MVLLSLAKALMALSGLLEASFELSAATRAKLLDALLQRVLMPEAFELEAAE